MSYRQVFTKLILTWLRGNHDHQGGSSRARPFHCTKDGLTLAINPNVINSGVQFLVVGDCVRAVPCVAEPIISIVPNFTGHYSEGRFDT